MFCKKCGTEMANDAEFCPNCGEKTAAAEAVKTEQTAVTVASNKTTTVSVPEKTKKEKKPIPKKVIIAAGGLVAVVLLVVVISSLFKGGSKEHLLYVKDNELVSVDGKKSNVIDDEVFENKNSGSEIEYYIEYSDDGKYVYYPQEFSGYRFDLYYSKVGKKNAEATKIASNVYDYALLDGGKVLYLTDSKMYLYNQKKDEKEKVASDVSYMVTSEDKKQVMWRTNDDDLYVSDAAFKKDKIKIESNISSLIDYSDDFKQITYTKNDKLYMVLNYEDKRKVASEVYSYVESAGDSQDIYYMELEDKEELTLMDFVDDDMFDSDKSIKEPRIEDYQTQEKRDTYWGEQTYTVTADEYYEKLREFSEKESRDRIRKFLEEEPLGIQKGCIYRYDVKKDESVLVQEVHVLDTCYEENVMAYTTLDVEKVEKMKFSDIVEDDDYYDIEEIIEERAIEGLSVNLFYNGKSVPLSIGNVEIPELVDVMTTSDEKICYIMIEDEGSDNYEDYLYKTNLAKFNGNTELISDEVEDIMAVTDAGVYYMVDVEDGLGDLYCNQEKLDSDVKKYSIRTMKNGKGVLYLADADDEEYVGTLKLHSGSKVTEIAEDVSYYMSSEKGGIAFLTDYSFKKYEGTLKTYEGKKVKTIAEDVSMIAYYY